MVTERDKRQDEFEELLDLIPAYRRGELSPAQAHKISILLDEAPRFRAEAAREEALVGALSCMKEMPVPRGLIARSVKEAVGEAGSASWFSIDTLLVAIGVGVGCAATAQFLSGKVDILPALGGWLGELAGVAVNGSLGNLLGGVAIGSAALVLGGVFWTIRLLRSKE